MMFAIMEFTTALVSGGAYMTIFIMSIEMSGPSKRVFGGALISAFYSSSQVVTGIAAMYFHNFRTLLQVLIAPTFMLLIYVWVIPESMRWLLSKGKTEEAKKIIVKAAKINKVTLSDSTLESLLEPKTNNLNSKNDMAQVKECNANNPFLVAMKSKLLICRLINCLICWFTNSFIYYGLIINSSALPGNKYINYILVNLVEIPAVIVAYHAMDRFGRKFTLITCMIISGIACVSSEVVPTDADSMKLILFILGKVGVTISFTVLYVFTSELFPTYLRHSFMNACSTFGSIGSMIAPQTVLLVCILFYNNHNITF